MKTTATIVLPVHNGERLLRPVVYRILDLAEIVGRRLRVVVLDDGSTDETYEAACELARMFPQVIVLRQQFQRGIGPALDQVRRQLAVEQIILHDGVTPINVDELADLLREQDPRQQTLPAAVTVEARGSRRFAAVASLNAQMTRAHRATTSLRWLRLEHPLAPRRQRTDVADGALREGPPVIALGVPNFGISGPLSTR